jgi:hypothetical protein
MGGNSTSYGVVAYGCGCRRVGGSQPLIVCYRILFFISHSLLHTKYRPRSSSTSIFRMTRLQCSSLITLGTPHLVSPFALVDQTRGLISEIEQTPSCSPRALQEEHGIDITCVCSSGVNGNFWDGFSTATSSTAPLETLIAAASYLPLVGTMNTRGDGIVPLPVAFLEDTRHVILEQCSVSNKFIIHSHVLPTPWNLWNGTAPSISLLSSSNDDDTYVSYVSPGVVSQWAPYIR